MLLGFIWLFMLSIQTKILAKNTNCWLLGMWTFLVSIVWFFMVRNLPDQNPFFYAFGTALGSMFATKLGERMLANRPDHHHEMLKNAGFTDPKTNFDPENEKLSYNNGFDSDIYGNMSQPVNDDDRNSRNNNRTSYNQPIPRDSGTKYLPDGSYTGN